MTGVWIVGGLVIGMLACFSLLLVMGAPRRVEDEVPPDGNHEFHRALAIAGFPLKPASERARSLALRPGSKIAVVQWDGCMAHIRNERGRGTVVRRCNSLELWPRGDSIDGIVYRLEGEGRDRFASLLNLRLVDGRLEEWH